MSAHENENEKKIKKGQGNQSTGRYVFCWAYARQFYIVVFAIVAMFAVSSAAHAELEYYGEGKDTKGENFEIWFDYNKGITVFYGESGKVYIFYEKGKGNPNPVDGTTSPGDYGSMEDLLKQQGGTGYLQPEWQDTPLGEYLGDQGVDPYHNPSTGDDSGGLSPSNIGFKTPEQLAEEVFAGGGVGSHDGYHSNGGSIGSQLGRAIRTGGSGGDGSSDDDVKPSVGGFWGEEMPGPPELVNPSPEWTSEDEIYFQLMLFEMELELR